MKPIANSIGVFILREPPHIVAIQLKILIPVGTAMTMVAAVKYARVSTSRPTVYMWCAQTIKPKIPIESIAKIMPMNPKMGFPEKVDTIWLMMPKPGKIKMYTSG